MQPVSDVYKKTGTIHYAYAIQGNKEIVLPTLLNFLEKDFGVTTKNNPDFSLQEFESISIDDARDLKERLGRRAISSKKVFILAARFITIEAQNALLKLFEEPTENTHLFLIMPNTNILLPTLKSRLVVIDQKNASESDRNAQLVKKFLANKPAERLILIKEIVEEKDKGKAIDFVTALEINLAKRQKDSTVAKSLSEILLVKKYLHDRASSVKLLLEHLSLVIPN